MKRVIFYVVMALSLVFVLPSCDKDDNGGVSTPETGGNTEGGGGTGGGGGFVDPQDDGPISVNFEGAISHDTYTPNQEAFCEVNRIPKSFAKFKEMFEQAAVEPQGAATMFIVAIEMFRQNPAVGERCMAYALWSKDVSDPNKVPAVDLRKVKEKLLRDDDYAQPYIPMAYFEGATPANKYVPTKYKCKCFVPPGKDYGALSAAQSFVIPLGIYAYGKDWQGNPNRWHNISVVKPKKAGYPKNCYVVFGWNDLFMGVLPPTMD